MRDPVRALWPTIRGWYGIAFGVAAAVVPFFEERWGLAGHVMVLVTALVVVPVVVYVVSEVRRPRAAPDEHFGPHEEHRALTAEQERARARGVELVWQPYEVEVVWRDRLLLFWHKTRPLDADRVAIDVVGDELTPAQFEDVPALGDPGDERHKAALAGLDGFLSDQDARLLVRPVRWEFARWVEEHTSAFEHRNGERVTAFGIPGLTPHPSILCTHNVVTTADGWVLLSFRSPRTDYYPRTWSVSFEEQVEIGARLRDPDIGATVRRGVDEEFGPTVAAGIRGVDLLAVGRQHDPDGHRVVRGGVAVTEVRLELDLDDVWAALHDQARIPDLTEHFGWAALRPRRRRDVLDVLGSRPVDASVGVGPEPFRNDASVSAPVRVHPATVPLALTTDGHGWHPTSRARLWLWMQVADADGRLGR